MPLGATTSTNYSITVNAGVLLGPASLSGGTVNVAYNQTITASGGTGNKTLAVTNIQNAIAGLVVPASGSNTLSITGTPTAAGTETFTVTATDALGATTSTNYSITVGLVAPTVIVDNSSPNVTIVGDVDDQHLDARLLRNQLPARWKQRQGHEERAIHAHPAQHRVYQVFARWPAGSNRGGERSH